MIGRALAGVVLTGWCSCGGSASPAQPAPDDAKRIDAPARLELDAQPLGLPDLGGYAWRKRAGHAEFRLARKAEASSNWQEVAKLCERALASDATNLEAAWLLAAAYGELGRLDALVAPLRRAAAGDFGKWGLASLELPAFAKFFATPTGEAWKRRVEQDRAAYVGVLARSIFVLSDGDVYAFDPDVTKRWYRLTRTFGAVIAAFRVADTKLAYVTRQRAAGAGKPSDRPITLAIGLADLTRGKTSRAVELGTKGPIMLASPADGDGVMIGGGTKWRRFDNDFRLKDLPANTPRPPGRTLEVRGKSARLRALPVPGVAADWDDKGLASAIRIAKSSRVISVPAPGLIDGHSIVWSPDRSKLAFVALLQEQCTETDSNAAVFVADAMTGSIEELERGDRLAVEWAGERLLIAARKRVTMRVPLLPRAHVATLGGADAILAPHSRARCTPEPDDPQDEPPPVETDPSVAP